MVNVLKKWATVILLYKLWKKMAGKNQEKKDSTKLAAHVNSKIKYYSL